MEKDFWADAEIISSYSRAEAIADGVLIDITEPASHCGYRVPVAITCGAWTYTIEPDQAAQRNGEDSQGRLSDMLIDLYRAIKSQAEPDPRLDFGGYASHAGSLKPYKLSCVSGPGDNGEHVLTIMKTDED